MRRSEARQGVRMMKFLDILGRYEAAEFSQLEAAELLGVGERTFRRWRDRFVEEGRERACRPADRPALGQAGGGGGDSRGCCGSVPRALRGLHGEAFSRASGEASRVQAGLHRGRRLRLHAAGPLRPAMKRSAHGEASAPADAGHDAAPGRLAARMARRPAGARSDRDDGRRHEHDLLGLSGRGGRHGFELSRPERGVWRARPAAAPLYGPGQPLFSYAEGGGRSTGRA